MARSIQLTIHESQQELEHHLRCQDETRLGLHTITGGLLTLKGVKPHGPTQWRRDNFYLYGVVEPLTGDSYFYEYSHLDSCCKAPVTWGKLSQLG
jgi:hypothetical protein